jgi:hypothetical protein
MIKIPVEIDEHDLELFSDPENLLCEWSNHFHELVKEGLKMDEEELFAYAIFVEWADSPGWNTYKDLARKLPNRREQFEEYVHSEEGSSICLTRPPTRNICEALGVGATLTLTARVLGLTNADFRRIPETSKHKTLDYEHPLRASNGNQLIRVEAKGTHDGKSVASQRASIKEKKASQRDATEYDQHSECMIGVIFDLQYKRPRGSSRLIVLDPPADQGFLDPAFVQLVNRLNYYSKEVAHISRGQLAVALANRTRDVEALKSNWRALDGLQLLSSRGQPVSVYETTGDWVRSVDGTVFNGRLYDLRLTEEARRGPLSEIREKPARLYFRGLIHQSLKLLAKQDFEALRQLRFDQRTFRISGRFDGEIKLLPSGLAVGLLKPRWYRWDEERLPEIWYRVTGRKT